MKKLTAVLLSVLMVFSLSLPALAVTEEYPTIYVTGAQTNNLFSAEGEKIYPLSVDIVETLVPCIVPALDDLALGLLTKDYDEYVEVVRKDVAPIFEKVVLDKNGEAVDGSHPEYHSSTVSVSSKQSDYGMWDFRFWYDWRLSPLTTAKELKAYIDRVIDNTGKDKVQLVGRCYGANVIQAYITLYKDHALENVSDISYYASSVSGIDYMSALFSGEVFLDEKALTNFLEYYLENENLIEDDILSGFIYTFVELLRHAEVLGIGTDALLRFFNEIKSDLIPGILPSILGTWPSYWAMVTPELYEKSVEFIFGDKREEYAGLIEKTDYYHYNVQLCAEETILELQEKGINFYIFSKYGFPDMPLYKGAACDGDTTTSIPRQSFGAECADYDEIFDEGYLSSLEDKAYLSPDLKINASTALIPQRSWFIKNLHHNDFAELHAMTLEIMRYDLTVENDKYPQYMTKIGTYDFVPTTEADADLNNVPDGIIGAAIRFLTAFIRLITGLLEGTVSFELGNLPF